MSNKARHFMAEEVEAVVPFLFIPTPINSLTSYVGWAPAHLCKPRCKRLLFQSSRFGGQEPTLRKINLLFGVGIRSI
jgi:hypothetical protein